MSKVTYYVVQPYVRSKRGKLTPGTPQTFKSEEHAMARGQRYGESHTPAVVTALCIDREVGELGEPIILGRFGEVPDEVFLS